MSEIKVSYDMSHSERMCAFAKLKVSGDKVKSPLMVVCKGPRKEEENQFFETNAKFSPQKRKVE